MKQHIKVLASLILVCVFVFSVTLSGCKKDKAAPKIPSLSTFQMEYALDTNDASNKDIQTAWNFLHAGTNVFFWNVVIGLNMIVPVAAFGESFNHTAVYDNQAEDWTWSYTFGDNYSARLVASLDGDYVHWEMYISKTGWGAFSEVLWYSGDSKTDGTEGTWVLNYNATNPTPLVNIVWHNDGAGTSDIKYTNIIPNHAGNGGYIHYGLTTDQVYNAFYNISIIEQSRIIEIEWNTTTKNGHVMDTIRFDTTAWQCWDENYQDVVCN